jgi:hypothetical protein
MEAMQPTPAEVRPIEATCSTVAGLQRTLLLNGLPQHLMLL